MEYIGRKGEQYKILRLGKNSSYHGKRVSNNERTIEELLKAYSLQPIDNPLHRHFKLHRLCSSGDVYRLTVVDFLHTVLLGVVSTTFKDTMAIICGCHQFLPRTYSLVDALSLLDTRVKHFQRAQPFNPVASKAAKDIPLGLSHLFSDTKKQKVKYIYLIYLFVDEYYILCVLLNILYLYISQITAIRTFFTVGFCLNFFNLGISFFDLV
jgi:hypothetical protein